MQLALLLIISLISWIWVQQPQLSLYSLQLVALGLIIVLTKNLVKKTSFGFLDLLILNLITLLLVFNTGGPSSPFFFLVYFLLFAFAFLLTPSTAIGFSFFLTLLLIPQIHSWTDLAETFSLLLVAPLALFFGQQYLKNLTDQKRIKIFQTKWLEDEKTIEAEEKEILLWLSLNFRNSLAEIGEIIAELLSDLSQLSPKQKALLKKMRRKIKKLLKQGEIVKKKIDRLSEKN